MKLQTMIRMPKNGQSCKKGSTSVEIKIGKTSRKFCVRGKAGRVLADIEKALRIMDE